MIADSLTMSLSMEPVLGSRRWNSKCARDSLSESEAMRPWSATVGERVRHWENKRK